MTKDSDQLGLEMDMSGNRFTPNPDIVKINLDHYRQVGFPYIRLSEQEKRDEFNSLVFLDTVNLIVHPDHVKSDSTGVSLANSYHPHRYGVVCNDKRTALHVFGRDHLLKKCIEKCLKMNGAISNSKLRSMISIFEGVQVASNFPPGTAKAIYEYFLPNSGSVWDMSMGFGGRLLAALSTASVTRYQGTDPSTLSWQGVCQMSNELVQMFGMRTETDLACQGSEVALPNSFKSVDLCFTSPPYFNTEKYAREDTQSFLKYPYQNDWLKEFIGRTIKNCLLVLRPSGYLVVNIANVNSFKHLEKAFVRVTEENGFRLVETVKLEFQTMPGQGKRNRSSENAGSRSEPIFIFKPR